MRYSVLISEGLRGLRSLPTMIRRCFDCCNLQLLFKAPPRSTINIKRIEKNANEYNGCNTEHKIWFSLFFLKQHI